MNKFKLVGIKIICGMEIVFYQKIGRLKVRDGINMGSDQVQEKMMYNIKILILMIYFFYNEIKFIISKYYYKIL